MDVGDARRPLPFTAEDRRQAQKPAARNRESGRKRYAFARAGRRRDRGGARRLAEPKAGTAIGTSMAAGSASRKVIYAALAGNLAVALTKFAASWWTGSSAMMSEGVHSVVDTSNQLLLLYGIHRASFPPDEDYPLGHGRELYFWSFIVALLIFSLGAGVSFYEGITHIQAQVHITDPHVNYIV